MWYSNDMFHHMFKAEFVTLVSLKVPSGGPAKMRANHGCSSHLRGCCLRAAHLSQFGITSFFLAGGTHYLGTTTA